MIELIREREVSVKDKAFKQFNVGKMFDFEKNVKFTAAAVFDDVKENQINLVVGFANGNLAKVSYTKHKKVTL